MEIRPTRQSALPSTADANGEASPLRGDSPSNESSTTISKRGRFLAARANESPNPSLRGEASDETSLRRTYASEKATIAVATYLAVARTCTPGSNINISVKDDYVTVETKGAPLSTEVSLMLRRFLMWLGRQKRH